MSANSRDIIIKSGRSCLHLPGQTCPVWSQWEELLNAVEAHLRRKELLQEPPSTNQKFELAMCVVERIAKVLVLFFCLVMITKRANAGIMEVHCQPIKLKPRMASNH